MKKNKGVDFDATIMLINEYLEEHQMSKSAFAEEADIYYGTLKSIYERRNLALITCIKLADYMEIGIDELIGRRIP